DVCLDPLRGNSRARRRGAAQAILTGDPAKPSPVTLHDLLVRTCRVSATGSSVREEIPGVTRLLPQEAIDGRPFGEWQPTPRVLHQRSPVGDDLSRSFRMLRSNSRTAAAVSSPE